jgi:hypothetical protein
MKSFSLMGGCESSSLEARQRNAEINKIIEKDRRINDSTVKLLLLGAGEQCLFRYK